MGRVITWSVLFQEALLLALPFLLAGLVFGYFSYFVLAALIAIIGWHAFHLIKLARWASQDDLSPPDGLGSWEKIYTQLYMRQKNEQRSHIKTQRQLRRTLNMAQSLPDALLIIAGDTSIMWFNQYAGDLLGLRWPEDAGQYIGNLLRHPSFIEHIEKKKIDTVLKLPSPLNAERTLELRFAPYQHSGRVILMRDITHLKQLESMRQNFFANVSHELRTPMTVLQGYLEMAKDPTQFPAPMWDKAHTVMMEQLDRMNALISQLLTLSKIEDGKHMDDSEPVNVPQMLQMLEKETLALGKDKAHKLDFSIDVSLIVKANAEQLRSAISNLIYNAVKYTPENCSISVRWFLTAQGARLEVTDTGDGIAPEHILHLTERFYRVDKARSRSTGGSGLGLAIVKHVLNHYNTHLEIESEVGKGSTFAFTLPLNISQQATLDVNEK